MAFWNKAKENKEEKIDYFVKDKPFGNAVEAAEEGLNEDANSICEIWFDKNNLEKEVVDVAIARADFPIYTYFKTNYRSIYISKKNEKKLYDLIENIKMEIEKSAQPVRVENTLKETLQERIRQNPGQHHHPLNQNFVPRNEIIPIEIPEEIPEEISDEDKKIEEEIAKENKKSSKKKLNRSVQKMTRFTPDEWKKIEEKISSAGVSQGDYMRSMMLKGKIVIKERTKKADEILENLKEIKSETGKIGGMVKQIMAKEENLSADEKEKFFAALKTIQDIKTELEQIERKV